MNKKKLLVILVFVVCVAGAAAIYLTRSDGTVKPELKSFAVEDTGSVDKIFLADKSSHEVLLTRESPGRWKVNGQYYAREDMIDNLLDMIHRVTVRSIVAKAAQENVIKRMASGSIKVEIYKKGELHKVYYVGSGTQDNLGSFMLLENSSAPFICFLPGHKGSLANYFMPLETAWRDHVLFRYKFQDMASVSVAYPQDPANNFTLEIEGNNTFRLRSDASGSYLPTFDTSRVKAYLLEFKNIAFEDFTHVPSQKMDSIRTQYPLFVVSVKEKGTGRVNTVKGYKLPLPPGLTNDYGQIIPFDEDRMYGEATGIKEELILQYLTFDRILVPLTFFKK